MIITSLKFLDKLKGKNKWKIKNKEKEAIEIFVSFNVTKQNEIFTSFFLNSKNNY